MKTKKGPNINERFYLAARVFSGIVISFLAYFVGFSWLWLLGLVFCLVLVERIAVKRGWRFGNFLYFAAYIFFAVLTVWLFLQLENPEFYEKYLVGCLPLDNGGMVAMTCGFSFALLFGFLMVIAYIFLSLFVAHIINLAVLRALKNLLSESTRKVIYNCLAIVCVGISLFYVMTFFLFDSKVSEIYEDGIAEEEVL